MTHAHANQGTGIGAAVLRVEDARLLTGRGSYTDDMNLPGQAYAAFVRSEYAHARIRAVDTGKAAAMPGVLAVLTAADLRADGVRPLAAQGNPKDVELKNCGGAPIFYPPIDLLAADKVRRVGEAVALVVAETEAKARDAAERVAVACDALQAVVDPRHALAPGAPLLWDQRPDNLCVDDRKGGAAAAARALGRLHRQGVIHRDIKPANLHRGADGRWRILDLSVALSGRESATLRTLHAGTPSYMNPEQWGIDGREKEPADAGSDLFALGVTLYRWLTGGLPYGEIEPYQRAPFRRDPVAPSRRRPDVPIWLDHVVLKAVARDPTERFTTGEEMALALERGASRPLTAPLPTPLVTRDPAALWKLALLVSLLFNVLLVVWLFLLPS